ncbi:MAG: type I DNA topoisomerase [Endomicrobia bacterium]|nr:type I DNA topoisomerase [Endomicrobiia bacterium]
MKLIIVESPTKEKTISRFLQDTKEDKFVVKSSYGHVRDLPRKSLGVDEKDSFKPSYIILPKSKKIISELKKIVTQAKDVYLATDYDREGESIAWHLVVVLGLDINKVKRITFHEITPKAILEALNHPRKIDKNLVDSQQARRVIDRLVGYKLSPLLWKKIANKLSAGRVQSVALKFIYDREKLIEDFKPQEYWTVEGEFSNIKDVTDNLIKAKLTHIDNKKLDKLDIKTEEEAEKIVKEIKSVNTCNIDDIKTDIKQKSPPPPYITATLQQEASWKLKFSPSKTMFIAQSLYEGVEIDTSDRIGLITYMRTDSTYVSPFAVENLRKFVCENYGKDYLCEIPRKYKTKVKNAQEAHEAIRPTDVYLTPEKLKKHLTQDQYKLYELIWKRFVATQMKDMSYKNITIYINVKNKYIFTSEYKKIIFDGYSKVLEEEISSGDKVIENLSKNDSLYIINCFGKQHFTEPPQRYTEASLIKELEKNGIGRPSTYATIVDTLKSRGYVNLKERKFCITPLGKSVIELLSNFFPEVVDKNYTAKIEEMLDKISEGKENWVKVVSLCYEPLIKSLNKASMEIKSKHEIVSSEKCKLCGADLIVRNSKYGKFLSCKNFPKCKYKQNYESSQCNNK